VIFFCGLQFLSFDALVCVKVGDPEDFRDHGQWTGVLDLILFAVEMKKKTNDADPFLQFEIFLPI
jgi:hypothetical protein